jgi:hypothetical protein
MRHFLILLILLFSGSAFALEIKSSDFENGGNIPVQYTCAGGDISPALSWSGVPAGAKSFVLICDDPDAPFRAWVHWVIFNIPAQSSGFAQGVPKKARLDDGTIQGLNDFGRVGYGGPCPPPGKPHRYFFKFYCLDSILSLDESATRADCLAAMKGRVISEAEIFASYER